MNFPFRIGQGFDVHALVPGRALIVGGVRIPFEHGLLGHSDADVLLHAVTDALLGAAGLGDIGRLFRIPIRPMPVPTAACCCARPSRACARLAGRW
jgi:2-C-methyl-D-erythritol 2,4-cyclodiphosphate synthase (EC 4.6.1.12)